MQFSVNSRHPKALRLQNARAHWDARGSRILRYTVEATNVQLNLHKSVSAPDIASLEIKLQATVDGWDAKIDKGLEASRLGNEKRSVEQQALEAEGLRQAFQQILQGTLKRDDRIAWDVLKSKEIFRQASFPQPAPQSPVPPVAPPGPMLEEVGFFSSLFGGKRKARDRYESRLKSHESVLASLEQRASEQEARYRAALKAWQEASEGWQAEQEARMRASLEVQQAQHQKVDALRESWLAGDPNAIVEHATLVLDSSDYGGLLQPDFELNWVESSRILVVNYRLPSIDSIPDMKTARFIASTGEIKTTQITEKQRAEIYDAACYQICLRTLHELFEADEPSHFQTIVFNGIVSYVDRATGKDATATILSVAASRSDFVSIDLGRVDPKACFKSLKGVAAASLANMAAVPPVMTLNKSDPRFVDSRTVDLDGLNSQNLAAMPWEDFEHLIRQLFEQLFSGRGGEVKVTQASRDGGVDAVAFDPDPIGGGKIIIQAKRYTRTVGVSAVRDLFGTVMAEGANKGILVTTADYGPDAYRFAQGKPLTLLSGGNLLHLLGQHGVNARIDLEEARRAQV